MGKPIKRKPYNPPMLKNGGNSKGNKTKKSK